MDLSNGFNYNSHQFSNNLLKPRKKVKSSKTQHQLNTKRLSRLIKDVMNSTSDSCRHGQEVEDLSQKLTDQQRSYPSVKEFHKKMDDKNFATRKVTPLAKSKKLDEYCPSQQSLTATEMEDDNPVFNYVPPTEIKNRKDAARIGNVKSLVKALNKSVYSQKPHPSIITDNHNAKPTASGSWFHGASKPASRVNARSRYLPEVRPLVRPADPNRFADRSSPIDTNYHMEASVDRNGWNTKENLEKERKSFPSAQQVRRKRAQGRNVKSNCSEESLLSLDYNNYNAKDAKPCETESCSFTTTASELVEEPFAPAKQQKRHRSSERRATGHFSRTAFVDGSNADHPGNFFQSYLKSDSFLSRPTFGKKDASKLAKSCAHERHADGGHSSSRRQEEAKPRLRERKTDNKARVRTKSNAKPSSGRKDESREKRRGVSKGRPPAGKSEEEDLVSDDKVYNRFTVKDLLTDLTSEDIRRRERSGSGIGFDHTATIRHATTTNNPPLHDVTRKMRSTHHRHLPLVWKYRITAALLVLLLLSSFIHMCLYADVDYQSGLVTSALPSETSSFFARLLGETGEVPSKAAPAARMNFLDSVRFLKHNFGNQAQELWEVIGESYRETESSARLAGPGVLLLASDAKSQCTCNCIANKLAEGYSFEKTSKDPFYIDCTQYKWTHPKDAFNQIRELIKSRMNTETRAVVFNNLQTLPANTLTLFFDIFTTTNPAIIDSLFIFTVQVDNGEWNGKNQLVDHIRPYMWGSLVRQFLSHSLQTRDPITMDAKTADRLVNSITKHTGWVGLNPDFCCSSFDNI